MLRDSKETELGSSNQEASPSAVKNTGVVLVPFVAWNCVLTAFSGDVEFASFLGVICYHRSLLSECHKITSRIGVS